MTKQIKISIIIPTNLDGNLLSVALRSIAKTAPPHTEVIIINNNSARKPKLQKLILQYKSLPNYRFFTTKTNLYFAKAINLGLKHAKGKYIFISNDDITFRRNTLPNLLTKLRTNPRICVTYPTILDAKTKKLDTYGGAMDIFGFCYKITSLSFLATNFFFIGVGLYHASHLKKLGAFDPSFNLMWEDADLSWRIHLAGLLITHQPSAIIYHNTSATTKLLPKDLKIFNIRRNRLRGLLKNYSLPLALTITPLTVLLYILLATHESISSSSLKPLLATLKSIAWNILNIRSTLKQRSIVQKQIRKVNDFSILAKLTPPKLFSR